VSSKLEGAVRAAPDDLQVWSIYGDSLEADGDPRGQWVGLQLAREASPNPQLAKAERAFFEANKDWLLGPELLKHADKAVWLRGFLYSAEVDTRAALEALVVHPSAKFLRAVVLNPMMTGPDVPDEDWSSLIEGASWQTVTVRLGSPKHQIEPKVVLALPNLTRLDLALPHGDPPAFDWSLATRLQSLTLEHGSPEQLEALLDNLPPKLRELRLERFDGRALDVLSAHANSPKLAFVAADGQMPIESMDALAIGQLPTRLLLNQDPEPEARLVVALPGVTEVVHAEGLETAWLVLDTPHFDAESRAVLIRLAQECRCEQLIAFPGTVRLPGRAVTVVRLHSDDTSAALLPSFLAHAIAKARQVRCGVFTVSSSNDLTRGLVFGGPVVEKPPGKCARPRVELAAAHKNEGGHYQRDGLVRSMLDHMLGFDPGLDAVNRMLDAIDESLPLVLHGKPLGRGAELPPLLTEEPAVPEPEGEEEEEPDYEDVEAADEQWDEPDAWVPDAVAPTDVHIRVLVVCTRCLAHAETKQCTQCREQLCESCLPLEDERPAVCGPCGAL